MKELLKEAFGDAAVLAAAVILCWLYCKVTPDQLSGEADLFRQECADKGVEL